MSEPVVLLSRDYRLDQLSLQLESQKPVQVGLETDAELDCSALQYCSSSGSGIAGRRVFPSRRRKRRTLAHPFNQLRRRKAAILDKQINSTSAIPSVQDGSERTTILRAGREPSTSTPEQDGCEQNTILGAGSKQPLTNMSGKNGREQDTILSTGSKPPTKISKHDDCEQTSIVPVLPLNPVSGLRTNVSDRDDCELATPSNKLSCISGTRQDTSVSKEDFMALLCLSPAHVVARVRTCNHHIISKLLHTKSCNLWRKICGTGNCRYSLLEARAALRSFKVKVLLERNNFIDRLALQPDPQSINLKNIVLWPRVPKATIGRKRLIDLCRWKPHSVSVVLNRDSDIDRLALQVSNVKFTSSSSKSSGMSIASSSRAKGTTTAPLSTDTTSSRPSWLSVSIKRDSCLDEIALQSSDSACQFLSSNSPGTDLVSPSEAKCTTPVNLSTETTIRDSGLDMFALKTPKSRYKYRSSDSLGLNTITSSEGKVESMAPLSTHTPAIHVMHKPDLKTFSIKIKRDSCIDQLALQTSNTTVMGNNPSVPHQLTPSISPLTKMPTLSTKNSLNRNLKGKLKLLPNLEVSKDSKVLTPRAGVIKLRRLISDDWCIIRPVEPGSESSRPESGDAKSTDSKNKTAELIENPCIIRIARLPTSSLSGSEGGFSYTNRSHDVHVHSSADQRKLSVVPSEQTTACSFFYSSTRRSFKNRPQTVSSISCSISPKTRTRSVPNEEDVPLGLDYNENENPQKHDVPLVKTVSKIGKHSSNGVGKTRVLTTDGILRNGPLKGAHTKSEAAPLHSYNLTKPSISSYMPVKKPLRVKSEFYSTFNNMNQLVDSPQSKK